MPNFDAIYNKAKYKFSLQHSHFHTGERQKRAKQEYEKRMKPALEELNKAVDICKACRVSCCTKMRNNADNYPAEIYIEYSAINANKPYIESKITKAIEGNKCGLKARNLMP